MMSIRSPQHEEAEKVIFEAFLVAHPRFAATVASWDQPEDEFPDVAVRLKNGQEIDFELGEWLHGGQMAQAMRLGRLEEAIGPQGENTSEHIYTVMLVPRDELPHFAPADAREFRRELFALIGDTEHRWPGQRFWHTPMGRVERDLRRYPILAKYVTHVCFHPLSAVGNRRPAQVPWIFVSRATSYSPQTALEALASVLRDKMGRYAGLTTPVRLVVYYGRAFAYNTPYWGVETRDFQDVAAAAAKVVATQTCFQRIYLLKALEPGLEAFEIFPNVVKCT